MSEKRARQKRAAQALQALQAPQESQESQEPAGQPGGVTVADLLQLLGSRDVEILNLQRQVVELRQQVQALAERLAKKGKKGASSEP